jgi:hypothetical protein
MNKRTKKRNYKKTNKKRKNNVSFKINGMKIMGGNDGSFQPFEQQSNQYYYNLNNYNNDPADNSQMVSSRNLPDIKGGKKLRKNKMKKTKKNKMKGGLAFNFDAVLGNNPINNSLTSLGQLGQIGIGSNILSGEGVGYNRLTFDNPTTFSRHNAPLV